MAGSPTFFGEGSTPRVHDTRWRILQKILGATIDGGGGGGGGTIWTYWEDANVDNNPPPDTTKAVMRRFRNGDGPVTWDPDSQTWV